jgi:predicted DNA-binding protein
MAKTQTKKHLDHSDIGSLSIDEHIDQQRGNTYQKTANFLKKSDPQPSKLIRTTIKLNPALHASLINLSNHSGKPMSAIMENFLENGIEELVSVYATELSETPLQAHELIQWILAPYQPQSSTIDPKKLKGAKNA